MLQAACRSSRTCYSRIPQAPASCSNLLRTALLTRHTRATSTVAEISTPPSSLHHTITPLKPIKSSELPQLAPEEVDPVLEWLMDDSMAQPHIPVKAAPLDKSTKFLPLAYLNPKDRTGPKKVIPLNPTIYFHAIRRDILHACVVWYLDSLRQGTASTKHRSEINGSGRKLRPQKGTGRARLGDRGSPMLRGGGRAFGPKPRSFKTTLPRKVKEMGMRIALSVKVKERMFGVVPEVSWPTFKTKELFGRLQTLNWGKTLFVTGSETVDKNFSLAIRNLKDVDVMTVNELEVYHLLKWPRVVFDMSAMQWAENNFAKQVPSVEGVPSTAEVETD